VNETWNLLRTNGFIALAPGINGVNGLMVLTRAGEEASASSKAFDRVRAGKSFPKTMLHPAIADERLVGAQISTKPFRKRCAMLAGSPPQISAWN
jgi:hypothetical protein